MVGRAPLSRAGRFRPDLPDRESRRRRRLQDRGPALLRRHFVDRTRLNVRAHIALRAELTRVLIDFQT